MSIARGQSTSLRLVAVGLAALALSLLSACGGGGSEDESQQSLSQDGHQQVLALSHSDTQHTAESLAQAKVCFYEHANFSGKRVCVGVGSGFMPSGLHNRVSSVTVPPGLRLELYRYIFRLGRSVTLTSSMADLRELRFNDLASSYRVTIGAAAPVGRNWSDPATWGGNKPAAGAAVVVPAGMHLVLDENTPDLGPLTLEGTLSFREGVTAELKAAVIMIRGRGALLAGSAAAPFTGRATVTLTASDPEADPTGSGMGTRGILIEAGGKLALFGNAPAVAWTRLGAHAEAAATTLQLAAPVSWQPGDQIVVAPTEWYPTDAWAPQTEHDASRPTERLTLKSALGQNLALDSALAAFKWGALQYITDQGMSLQPGVFTAPHPDAVQLLDERAEVGNLTRNIVIQGLDDALWRETGYGAQVMVMDRSSTLQLDGVELRQVGQAGKVGRYPIHWHLLSYNPATGESLGDAVGHFVRNSSVWNSRQRCMVIHGTNGVELRNNICYDIKGHAIFLEDAVERRNVIEGNLVLHVRSPLDAQLVALHERRADAGGCGGAAAGYWLTNPDNTVRLNAVADAQGHGFWLSYPEKPVKQGAKVPLRPVNMAHAPFELNSARANGHFGVALECAMTNDEGNTALIRYAPTTTGQAFDYSNGLRFELRGLTMAKNRAGGYLNRTTTPDYRQFAMAGNLQRSVTGAVEGGSLKQALIIGASLNNRQPYPDNVDPQLGIASYHSQMDIADNTFVAFANRGFVLSQNGWDKSSGTFGTDDYYVRPVDKGYWRNAGNRLIGSDPGYRALPPHLQPDYTPDTRNNWTLAGALWDPHGLWGTPGRYWVLDSPFLREGSCNRLDTRVPAGAANGLTCAGPYYGVHEFWLNRGLPGETSPWTFFEKLEVTRLDSADTEVGRWVVEAGHNSRFLGHMRHFAAVSGDSYIVRFPEFPAADSNKTPPRWVQLQVENLLGAADSVMLAIHYDGQTVPSRVMAGTEPDYPRFEGPNANARLLLPAADKAAVAAGAGDVYWQDTANQLVWIKATWLGLDGPWSATQPGSDPALYRGYRLRIEP